MNKNSIAVTVGDPNGIGPEVCAKAFRELDTEELKRIVLIGEWFPIEYYFKNNCPVETLYLKPEGYDYLFRPGEPSLEAGRLSFRFIGKAVELALEGRVGGIVTAPVSKDLIHRSGVKDFTDHTTYLAKRFGAKEFSMMFHSDKMKVILATIHLSLKDAVKKVNRQSVTIAVKNALKFCEGFYGNAEKYRIAVCGLNPHAGENGMLGKEEIRIIAPVIKEFAGKGFPVFGPFPADTLFQKANDGQYQMVVAMYHDQGLAPFKMLYMNEGVNVTLGLPIVRTSPDHGTAFDIAGKDLADPRSMLCALKLALKMVP